MIYDYNNDPRYADKAFNSEARVISPELKRLYIEMEQNPNYHISRECSFYPRGFPKSSPVWSVAS
jgi:hypothetical protein